ncbi:GNAT family N-acetyltransferase, partial [bacterium]|nr:GNAT family N-acetyltransferase [bacterium]
TSEELQVLFTQRQEQFLLNVEGILRNQLSPLIEQGVLHEGYIVSQIAKVGSVLSQIDFDFTHLEYLESSLTVPVILRSGVERRAVIRARRFDNEAALPNEYEQLIDSIVAGDYVLDVFSENLLAGHPKVRTVLGDAVDEAFPLQAREKFFDIIKIFGISTGELLLERYTIDELVPLLLESPSYAELENIRDLAPTVQVVIELLLFDFEGFLDLAYKIAQNDDDEESTEYIVQLADTIRQLSDRKLGRNRLPDFVIEPANLGDLNRWFGEPYPRTFSREQWEDAIEVPEHLYFVKARDPQGNILGLMTTSSMPAVNVVYINFLEVSSNTRGVGVGKELIQELARRNPTATILLDTDDGDAYSFYEKLGFNTLPREKERAFDLLPLKAGAVYLELTPEAGQELIGITAAKQKETALNASDVAVRIPQLEEMNKTESIERFGKVMTKFGKLSDEDRIFVISKMVSYLGLTIEQAIQQFAQISLEESNFYNTLQGIYDSMVDEYIAGFDTQQDIALAVVQLDYNAIPDAIPFFDDSFLVPELDMYRRIYSRLQETRTALGEDLQSRFDTDYSFNGTVAQSIPLLSNVRKVLQRHGIFYDIEVLAPDDPRIAEKAMVLIDNTLYVNQTIRVSDFIFYLSHEMSHILDGERSARQRDKENIQFMHLIAGYLLDAAGHTDDPQKQKYLKILANQLEYRASQYEFNVITATLQSTDEGKSYLARNNLPMLQGVSNDYLHALSVVGLATVNRYPHLDSPMMRAAQELGSQVRQLVDDDQLDITAFVRNLKRNVVATVLQTAIAAAQIRPDRVDALLSEWVAVQQSRVFWQTGDASVPPMIAEFIDRSTAELGYVDIRNIQQAVSRTLRQSSDDAYKTELEKQVVQWVRSLLRENISPAEGVTQLQDIIQQKCANCLGFSKLFDAVSTQFGLNVTKTVMDFSVEGHKELHAANIVRYSDGTTELIEVVDSNHLYTSGQNVAFNGIVVRKLSDDKWNYAVISLDELASSKHGTIKGLARKTVDAFSYIMRAAAIMENGSVEQALSPMLKAYELNPDVPYIAFNTAQLAFIHWLENQRQDIPEAEVIQKMRNFYEEYRLFAFSETPWQYFYESLDLFEQRLILVNSISSVGGGGDGRIPPYRRKVEPVNPAEKLPAKLPPKEPEYTKKEPPEEDEQPEKTSGRTPKAPVPASSLWTTLNIMAAQNQAGLLMQKATPNPAKGIEAYRMNQLVANMPGLALSTAAQMIKTGSQVEALIQQQNYARAQQMLMGLDPHFAERIMIEFPWVLVFMLELYPEWWRGKELRQIAKEARLDTEREEQMRLQLTSVQAVSPLTDNDPFRRPQGQNPLWAMISSDNTRTVIDGLSERGNITPEQYRALFDVTVNDASSLETLLDAHRTVLFGKRDEIPTDDGLFVQDGYLLGSGFGTPPADMDTQLYASFLTTVMEQHPEEVMALVHSAGDEAFLERLGGSYGISAQSALSRSRGALSVVADELFQSIDDFDLADGVRAAITANTMVPVLEALFSSNFVRPELQDIAASIYELNILNAEERAVLEYINKFYVDGDELTLPFEDAVSLMADIVAEYPFIGEKIVVLATRLKRVDPGKLLYALLAVQKNTAVFDDFGSKPAVPFKLTSFSPLIDQAM